MLAALPNCRKRNTDEEAKLKGQLAQDYTTALCEMCSFVFPTVELKHPDENIPHWLCSQKGWQEPLSDGLVVVSDGMWISAQPESFPVQLKVDVSASTALNMAGGMSSHGFPSSP